MTHSPRESNLAMQVGISAGTVWFALQDLNRNVQNLPAGELRDAWVEAHARLQLALDAAMEVHRKVVGP
jgi:hypothetical protein